VVILDTQSILFYQQHEGIYVFPSITFLLDDAKDYK